MDLHSQQFLVQERINDRLAEARLARLAREAHASELEYSVAPTKVDQPSRFAHLVAGVLAAAADVGRSIAPRPPVQVRVDRR